MRDRSVLRRSFSNRTVWPASPGKTRSLADQLFQKLVKTCEMRNKLMDLKHKDKSIKLKVIHFNKTSIRCNYVDFIHFSV